MRRRELTLEERGKITRFVKERFSTCEVCRHELPSYAWSLHNEISYADAGGYPQGSEAELAFALVSCDLCGNTKHLLLSGLANWLSLPPPNSA